VRDLLYDGPMTHTLGLGGLLALSLLCGCSSGSSAGGGADGGGQDGTAACPGVCASPSAFACASQFQTSGCLGGTCCVLAADAGPTYYDDAGSCPGQCASPDDVGCYSWYRSSVCGAGDLCCVPPARHGDAGTD
jgi:hypothetical protein